MELSGVAAEAQLLRRQTAAPQHDSVREWFRTMAGGGQRSHRLTQIITDFLFLLPIWDEAREGLRIRSKSFPISQWKAFRFQAHRQINGRYYWYPTPLR